MFVCICHGPHAEVKGPLVGVACILRIKLRSASLVSTFTHGATSLVLEIGFINAEAKPFFSFLFFFFEDNYLYLLKYDLK